MRSENYIPNGHNIIRFFGERAEFVPHVVHAACDMFDRLYHWESIQRRGVVLRSVCAACIYYGLKRYHIPWSPTEVRELFLLTKRQFTRGAKILLALPQTLEEHPVDNLFMRFGNLLHIAYPLLVRYLDVLKRNELLNLEKNTPVSLSAGILYWICLDQCLSNPSLETICHVTHASPLIINQISSNIQARQLEFELLQPQPNTN